MEVRDLSVHFELRGGTLSRLFGRDTGTIKAVDGIDLALRPGEVVGLVGESGSGKSTLGRALLGLVPATSGSVHLRDQNLADLSRRQLRDIRRVVQMVFQDPNAALNPSMTVEEAVGDALRVHGMKSATERRQGVIEALERVGLSPVELFLTKYPRDLSGGQKQRVVLARAIVLDPELLVADEPVSMLDMSVRAKILQLMLDLKQDMGLTYVYITHDLATAKYFCDRIAIMYLGRVVEIGPTEEIFANPRHPYTKALLAAIPEAEADQHRPARPTPRRDPRRRGAAARLRVPPPLPGGGGRLRVGVARPAHPGRGALDPRGRGVRRGAEGDRRPRPPRRALDIRDPRHRRQRAGPRDLGPDEGRGPLRAAVVGSHLDRGHRRRGHRRLRAGTVSQLSGGQAGSRWRACSTRTRAEPRRHAGRSTTDQWRPRPGRRDPGALTH